MKTITALAILCAAFLLAGCAGKQGDNGGNPMKQTTVVLETSKGNIEITLNPGKAPVTVANFIQYVREGFYNGTVFHRVMPGFMVQGGGFTPDGAEKPTHAPITLESGNDLNNLIGTVAMARTSVPDSATSQFFINVANNNFLDRSPGNDGYAVFGNVTSGMNVVNAIAATPTASRGPYDNWPVQDIVILKAYVKK